MVPQMWIYSMTNGNAINGPAGYAWNVVNNIIDPKTGRSGSSMTLLSSGGTASAPEPAALALLLPALPLLAVRLRRRVGA